MLANYRRRGYDFDAHYEDGLAGYREKRVMDVLLRDGCGDGFSASLRFQ